MTTVRIFIFISVVVVGMPIIWSAIRRAERHQADDPEKFAKLLKNYRLQLVALPVIAAFVAAFMELPNWH
jgi:hypothetical protein